MKLQNDRSSTMENANEINEVEDVAPFDQMSVNHDGDPSFLDDDSLPTSLIITNLDVKIFNDEEDRVRILHSL